MTRQHLADVCHDAAQITRADIFCPEDKLRPDYLHPSNALSTQVDTPAVGMAGPQYDGGLSIVSIDGAGGRDDAVSLPSSDEMYTAFNKLQSATTSQSALVEFEAVSSSDIASMPDWEIWDRHIKKILDAAHKSLYGIAYLYLVPFRVRGDNGSSMKQPFPDAGYEYHLVQQLRAVAPAVVVAMDRPSEKAAFRFQREVPQTEIIYCTGQRHRHDLRREALEAIAKRFS
jgi:hypothetical protein